MDDKLKGIMPAISSVCDENDVFLEDKFVELAKFLYEQGSHGLYVCGNTGDGFNMHLEERKRAAELAVEVAREYDGVTIIHVGTNNTRGALELTEHAAKINATAISSMPPINRSPAQIHSYYSDVAKASPLPLLIYHVPVITHVSLSLDEMVQLLDIEGVVGLKYTDWNLFFMKRLILSRPDAIVFSGFDEVLCLGLLYGAVGGIGSWYNYFPKLFRGIYDAVNQNNVPRAIKLQNSFLELMNFVHKQNIGAVIDHIARQRGYGQYVYRRPNHYMDPQELKKIEPELNSLIGAMNKVIEEK